MLPSTLHSSYIDSGICDTPMTGIFHDFNVFVQRPLPRFVRWGYPFMPATFELVRWYLQVDCIFNGIHRDGVSISDQCNRAAYLRFRDNVANYEPMGASRRQKSVKGPVRNTFWGRLKVAHPPLNLPSVTQATSWPRPAPIIRLVGLSISGMPDSAICLFNHSHESKIPGITHRGRPSVRDTSERRQFSRPF